MTEILTKLRENREISQDQADNREDVDLMIESGDYKALVETEEFGRLSEHGKIELVQRTVANKIELNNERFFRLVGQEDSENAVLCDERIMSLVTLQHALDVYAVQLENAVDVSHENDRGVVSIVESFASETQSLSEAA